FGYGRPTRSRRSSPVSPVALERPLHLALGVAVGDRLALVAAILTAPNRYLDLHAALLEVQARRDDREPLLANGRVQPLDLALVQQQLARAHRLVVRAVALVVRGDLHAVQPHLAVAHVGVALGQRRAAAPQRLDLGSGQDETRLEAVEQLI